MAKKSGKPTRARAKKKAKAPRAQGKPRSVSASKRPDRRRKGPQKRPTEPAAKKRAAKYTTLEKAARSAKGRRIVILFADRLVVPQTKGWKDKPGRWETLRGYGLVELVPMFADAKVVDRLERHRHEVRSDYRWPRFATTFVCTCARQARPPRSCERCGHGRTSFASPTWTAKRCPRAPHRPPYASILRSISVPRPTASMLIAWQFVGGIGEGQSCIDVETGWSRDHTRLAHLVAPRGTLLCGRHQAGGIPHGTCVLGIICGANPIIVPGQVGCAGIAPDVAEVRLASYVSAVAPPAGVLPVPADNRATGVAENIYAAVSHGIDFLRMRGGGVLLLEFQTADLLPLEILPAMRDLLESAKPDVTVVEAAGNGNLDLDGVQDDLGNFSLLRPEGRSDSGAVMVGSAKAAVFAGTVHDRFVQNQSSGSNFGSRLDCYAWGELIVTTASDVGDLCNLLAGHRGPRQSLPALRLWCGE